MSTARRDSRGAFRPALSATLAVLVGVPILCGLGVWQVTRGLEKARLLDAAATGQALVPMDVDATTAMQAIASHRVVRVQGVFLADRQGLLDNQVRDGQVGYDILTPLRIGGRDELILVDRGWLARGARREDVPDWSTPDGRVTLLGCKIGKLNRIPASFFVSIAYNCWAFRRCGVVLDALYTGQAAAGMFKAKLLAVTGVATAAYQTISSDGWMKLIQFKILRMDKWAGMTEPWYFHETFDVYYYTAAAKYSWWMPKILGTDIRQLGLRLTLDAAMLGVGGLMGIRVATSCILGAFINFVVLAPIMIQRGEIREYLNPAGQLVKISRGEIVNQWSLWWGVTMMVVGAMIGLFAKPELFTNAFKALTRKKQAAAPTGTDVLKDIELPLWMSFVGVPIFSVIGIYVTHAFFGVPWLLAGISLPLIFVLTVICTNSMALTSWTPTGSLSKITQFTMGAIDRTNPASNLIPAGMTAEIASNAANLLSDIKPGYMLGAKPRQQAVGHVIGIFAGALSSVPLFFLLFVPKNAEGVRSTATIVSEQFAMPAALQWKGVADLIAKGFSNLPASAIISIVVAALAAAVFEILRIRTKGRFPISAVSVGLGVVLPPTSCFAMWVGALIFWWHERKKYAPGSREHTIWVDGMEPICAGLISGAALIGIGNAIVNVLLN